MHPTATETTIPADAAMIGRWTRIGADRRLWAIVVTALYAIVVITTSVYHEPWRDEVVALSIARDATSFADLVASLKFEGHPILWYVVLREAYALVGQTWVLKVVSVASAVGAIFLFMRSPLPWWLRCLFAFSFYPLWQYSVVSRGYGLEMLLLFALCALHPRRREHPVALTLVLVALANTELAGFIIAVAAAAALVFEEAWRGSGWHDWGRDRRLILAAAVFAAGLALAVAVAFPDASHSATEVRRLDLGRISAAVGRAVAWPAGHSGGLSSLPALSVWVWAYFVYLTRRPAVLCFAAAALIGIEASFALVWGPAPWHLGNVLLVVIAAMWLDVSDSSPTFTVSPRLERARSWLGWILVGGLTVVLTQQVLLGVFFVARDLIQDYSSSRRMAEVLRRDPSLAEAVVIGEPDSWVTSLPYYADNTLYLPREGVYRSWGRYTRARQSAYDLDALLTAARAVRAQCECPVVITLGWKLEGPDLRTVYGGTPYEETFAITPDARAEFLAATHQIASLRGPTLTDEQYDVYVLR